MMGNLVQMPPRTKKPDPQCPECGGRGWRPLKYQHPGSAMKQSTVIICECAKVASGEAE